MINMFNVFNINIVCKLGKSFLGFCIYLLYTYIFSIIAYLNNILFEALIHDMKEVYNVDSLANIIERFSFSMHCQEPVT